MHLYPKIQDFVDHLNVNEITENRKQVLQALIDFIQSKVNSNQKVSLNFICTHNSRRSHLSQIWAQTMAQNFNIKNVYCYSGGTEATQLFPMILKTLQTSGFKINKICIGNNPVYIVKFAPNEHPIIGFSKKFDDSFNPQSDFAAIMTCSHADENCPFIVGAEKRIPITYDDPKAFDQSPQQAEIYKERSLQIAKEMFYVFSKIKF